jgi:anaerobic selenocysteine-containing dehydrogenase
VIRQGFVDRAFVEAHTVGFDRLQETVQAYDLDRVATICGVPAARVREAARILGTTERLVSTVLQGVYQSMGATAAACQVNNLHLLRGMIGRPGCAVFQMNGQPTAQNTRETGADGDLPGFRNWDNETHIRELAELWNVDPMVIPHWAPPTHAMQIWRYAEQGSIGLLWISATNPAVSLPELPRIRSILAAEQLFVVVQDAFLTETARFADVVLPTAIWGETTGTFTNTDRTVHCPSGRSTRPARPAATSTSGRTTPGGWASGTATASR